MIPTEKDNLYIKISELGNSHPQGFSYLELKKELKLQEWEDKTVKRYMDNALKSGRSDWSLKPGGGTESWVNPSMDSMFFVIEKGANENILDDHKFILKYDAYFNYIDYLELQESRKSSKKATYIAIVAIIISAGLAIASVLMQIYGSVALDNAQFNKIIHYIENKNNPK